MRKPRASVILGEFRQNGRLGSLTCDCSNQVRVDEEAQSLSHSGLGEFKMTSSQRQDAAFLVSTVMGVLIASR